jgi:hypothetical protein
MVGVEEDRTYKLSSGTTFEPGRYVKSLGVRRDGHFSSTRTLSPPRSLARVAWLDRW